MLQIFITADLFGPIFLVLFNSVLNVLVQCSRRWLVDILFTNNAFKIKLIVFLLWTSILFVYAMSKVDTSVILIWVMFRDLILTCFECHFSEVAPPGQTIWKLFGTRLVEEYVRHNARLQKQNLWKMTFPLRSFRSSFSSARTTRYSSVQFSSGVEVRVQRSSWVQEEYKRVQASHSSRVPAEGDFEIEEDRREVSWSQDLGHRPRRTGGWKEDQLPEDEDEACLESDLGSDNCWRLIVIYCGYKRGK
jgi:hypothetical protein